MFTLNNSTPCTIFIKSRIQVCHALVSLESLSFGFNNKSNSGDNPAGIKGSYRRGNLYWNCRHLGV